ncbi:hypothetical protein FA13DRAFT_1781940 [Coprinellus micaceus]|uniref:Uncharacterized protein n=1 Tax=Coprinellus micaceus TaxID=71717 RepID=A0A4Y7S7L0_COPMI|nr:hypothetical protein FA13DRAFT_1781940 [Coprinellus micaceus]
MCFPTFRLISLGADDYDYEERWRHPLCMTQLGWVGWIRSIQVHSDSPAHRHSPPRAAGRIGVTSHPSVVRPAPSDEGLWALNHRVMSSSARIFTFPTQTWEEKVSSDGAGDLWDLNARGEWGSKGKRGVGAYWLGSHMGGCTIVLRTREPHPEDKEGLESRERADPRRQTVNVQSKGYIPYPQRTRVPSPVPTPRNGAHSMCILKTLPVLRTSTGRHRLIVPNLDVSWKEVVSKAPRKSQNTKGCVELAMETPSSAELTVESQVRVFAEEPVPQPDREVQNSTEHPESSASLASLAYPEDLRRSSLGCNLSFTRTFHNDTRSVNACAPQCVDGMQDAAPTADMK